MLDFLFFYSTLNTALNPYLKNNNAYIHMNKVPLHYWYIETSAYDKNYCRSWLSFMFMEVSFYTHSPCDSLQVSKGRKMEKNTRSTGCFSNRFILDLFVTVTKDYRSQILRDD